MVAVTLCTVSAVVLAGEGDGTVLDAADSAVGDGDAVGIAGEVGEHGLGAAEGGLCVYDPFAIAQRCQEGLEGGRVGEARLCAEECQAAVLIRGAQLLDEEPLEQAREDADGQEEVGAARRSIVRTVSGERPPPGTIMWMCG